MMKNQVSKEFLIDAGAGISFAEAMRFLSDYSKWVVVGAVVGAIIGVVSWTTVGKYKAESVLVNNNAEFELHDGYPINVISWRNLQKKLPLLAGQIVAEKKVKPEEEPQYMAMSSWQWWEKSVLPTYSLTKADTKDLAGVSKQIQESAGGNILNLVVTATGSSYESALSNVDIATRFIREGSAYLLIQRIVSGYESQVFMGSTNLQKRILDAEVELRVMNETAHNLEILRQKFPSNAGVFGQQVVDLNDSNAKFMPISTQLVAINRDINSAKQLLQRLNNKAKQMKVMRAFVEQALPLIEKETNGIALADSLLKVTAAFRAKSAPEDTNVEQMLNMIEVDLVGTRAYFTKGLEADLKAKVGKPGPLLSALVGLFCGALLFLLAALGHKTIKLQSTHLSAND